jgi:hypothetical protein
MPAALMVPTVVLPPAPPLTCQFTAVEGAPPTVALKVCVLPEPATNVALVGEMPTALRLDRSISARQAVLPAPAGADVEAELGVTVTSALSVLPASSVTVTRTVNDPLAGATTVAVAAVEPLMVGGVVPLEPTTVHA